MSALSTQEIDNILFNVIDYYIEKWTSTPKPFKHTEYVQQKLGLDKPEAEAIRQTKPQNIKSIDTEGNTSYNLRKLNELPHFILKLNNLNKKIHNLIEHVYFDYEFMSAKVSLYDLDFLSRIGNDIWSTCLYMIQNEHKLTDEELELKQAVFDVSIMHYFYDNNKLLLQEFPQAYAFQLCSKLQHFCINSNRLEVFLKNLCSNLTRIVL